MKLRRATAANITVAGFGLWRPPKCFVLAKAEKLGLGKQHNEIAKGGEE